MGFGTKMGKIKNPQIGSSQQVCVDALSVASSCQWSRLTRMVPNYHLSDAVTAFRKKLAVLFSGVD